MNNTNKRIVELEKELAELKNKETLKKNMFSMKKILIL